MPNLTGFLIAVAIVGVVLAAALYAQHREDKRIAALNAEVARQAKPAADELHERAMREAVARHPVRRLSARWKPIPCEPPGQPLSGAEKDLLQGIWLGLEAYPLAEEPRPKERP